MLTVLIQDHPHPCCQDLCVWTLSFQRIINFWELEDWVTEIRSWKQIPWRHAIPNSFLSHSPRFLILQLCEKLSQTHNSVTMGVPSCTILSPWVDMLVHLWLLRPNEVHRLNPCIKVCLSSLVSAKVVWLKQWKKM